ncbi:MAG: hypothetical protein ACYTFW_17060 [Planctomycetota bacterium]|jgi:hypothetical protein
MAKDRTGLQSKISAIFSGVPVPKKDRKRSKPDSSKPESDSKDIAQPAAPEQTDQEKAAQEQAAPIPSSQEPTVAQPTAPESTVAQPTIPEPSAPEPTVAQPAVPEPTAPRPQTIEESELKQPLELVQEASSAKVLEARVPEPRAREIPSKVSRRRKEKVFVPKTAVKPKRQTTSIVLVIFLSIVLVFVLVRPFSMFRRNTTTPNVPGPTNVIMPAKADIEIPWTDPPIYPADLRDPMVLASQKQIITETHDLVVKGISYSEDRRYAVIGIQTLQEGDVIFDTTIIKINPNNVEFEKDGKRWTQEVEGE